MCKCTPMIRTPFCGRPGCEWPVSTAKQQHPLTDPREIRKLLNRVARYGERIDGNRNNSWTAAMVRNTLSMAEVAGLNGEDAMTLLAYHALLQVEGLTDAVLHEKNTQMAPMMVSKRAGWN